MKLDRFDRILVSEKFRFRKLHEEIGRATYLMYENVLADDGKKVKKVEMRRVDLEVLWNGLGSISSYRSETLCPYGGSKCASNLYSNELLVFNKKLRKMIWKWRFAKLKKRILKAFRR